MTEDEMVGWHHWLNGHEFEQCPALGETSEGPRSCEKQIIAPLCVGEGREVNLFIFCWRIETSLVAQMVKNLPAMQETQVQSLDWKDPLVKRMATHSSILAFRIPWAEGPGRLQSLGSQRVRHDWATPTTLTSRREHPLWTKRGFFVVFFLFCSCKAFGG